MTEKEAIDLRGKTFVRGFVHWLYQNGYEIISKKEKARLERTIVITEEYEIEEDDDV